MHTLASGRKYARLRYIDVCFNAVKKEIELGGIMAQFAAMKARLTKAAVKIKGKAWKSWTKTVHLAKLLLLRNQKREFGTPFFRHPPVKWAPVVRAGAG